MMSLYVQPRFVSADLDSFTQHCEHVWRILGDGLWHLAPLDCDQVHIAFQVDKGRLLVFPKSEPFVSEKRNARILVLAGGKQFAHLLRVDKDAIIFIMRPLFKLKTFLFAVHLDERIFTTEANADGIAAPRNGPGDVGQAQRLVQFQHLSVLVVEEVEAPLDRDDHAHRNGSLAGEGPLADAIDREGRRSPRLFASVQEGEIRICLVHRYDAVGQRHEDLVLGHDRDAGDGLVLARKVLVGAQQLDLRLWLRLDWNISPVAIGGVRRGIYLW